MSLAEVNPLNHWPEPPTDHDLLLRKQRNRYLILKFFYDQIGDNKFGTLGRYDVIKSVRDDEAMTTEEAESALDYLESERLIKTLDFEGHMLLEHAGRIEIEDSLQKPDQSTKHFPEKVFQIVVHRDLNYVTGSDNSVSNNNLQNNQFGGGFANRDQSGGLLQIQSHTPNLAEVASEIKQLLENLSTSHEIESPVEKLSVVTETVDQINKNPPLKHRVINVIKSAGAEALKEAIDHPLVSVFIAAVEGWQETNA